MRLLTSGGLHSAEVTHSKQGGIETASTNERCSENVSWIMASPSGQGAATPRRGHRKDGKEQPRKDLGEGSSRQRDESGLRSRKEVRMLKVSGSNTGRVTETQKPGLKAAGNQLPALFLRKVERNSPQIAEDCILRDILFK